jgi:phospholipid transport system substrate-binding protein
MISRRYFAIASAACALLPQLAFAQTVADPGAFISSFAQKGIVDVLAAPIPVTEKRTRFRTLFTSHFDIPAIARFVLGRNARIVTPEELVQFTDLFEDVIVLTWSRRFSEYQGQSLQVSGSTADGEDGALVKSTIVGNSGENFAVDWRLRKRPDGYKVVDIVVAGVSMAITYRQEYSNLIAQGGGFPGLVAQLEKQVAALKAQQAS